MTLISLVSLNANATECQRLGHSDGQTHEIGASLFSYTHIILPENVMKKTKPLVGNKELWSADSAGPHLYIKPDSDTPLGRTTSYSAVGESGKSYDFKVVRQGQLDNYCYRVSEGELFSDEERQVLSESKNQSPDELASLWKEKYVKQQSQAKEEQQKAVIDALRRYRYQIYTRYDWNKSGSSFIGKDFIADVYDDGRFTYIRVNQQNRGLMMVEATLEGQTELIEAKYDTLNKMYTISGIFPEFTMKYGNTKVQIQRANNETAGEY